MFYSAGTIDLEHEDFHFEGKIENNRLNGTLVYANLRSRINFVDQAGTNVRESVTMVT